MMLRALRAFTVTTAALLVTLGATPAMAQRDSAPDSVAPLFSPADPAAARSLAPESDPATLRSRVVQIDLDQLAAARDAARLVLPGAPPQLPVQGPAPPETSLTFNLFDDVVLPVTIDERVSSSVGYALSGRVDGDALGTVTLVVNGAIVVGMVETTEASYSIRTLGDEAAARWIIRHHDRSSFPAFDADEREAAPSAPERPYSLTPVPGTPSEPGPVEPLRNPEAHLESPHLRAPTGPISTTDRIVSLIEVQVWWTAAAAAAAGGHDMLRTEVALMVTNANLALRDGDLSMWIGWDGNPGAWHWSESERTTIRGDYDFFLANNNNAPNILADNKADYLHLIVSGPKTNSQNFTSCGVVVGRLTSPPRYAVTARGPSCRYTFAHELGHNMGLAHDRYRVNNSTDQAGIRTDAFGYINEEAFEPGAPVSKRWKTIMAYDDECQKKLSGSCVRLRRFSNRAQTHLDDPLGNDDASAISSLDATRTRWVNRHASGCSEVELTRIEFPGNYDWDIHGRWNTGCRKRPGAGDYTQHHAFAVTQSSTIAFDFSENIGGGSLRIRKGISHNDKFVSFYVGGGEMLVDLSPGYYTLEASAPTCCSRYTVEVRQRIRGVDLTIPSWTFPSQVAVEQEFDYSVTVRNVGSTDAPAVWTYREIRKYTTGDPFIWKEVASSGNRGGIPARSAVTLAVTKDKHLSEPGQWEARLCASAGSSSNEINTDNNCSSIRRFTVTDPLAPDLVVNNLWFSGENFAPIPSFTPGLEFFLVPSVRNQGTAASPETRLRLFRSDNSLISTSDLFLGSLHVPSIAPGDTEHGIQVLRTNAPETLGTYYYGACVDVPPGGESNLNNNCSVGRPITVTPDDNPDRAALVALYNATNGAGWTNSANWNTNAPLDQWFGVSTDAGRVFQLVLGDNNLTGPIPSSLGNLQELYNLILAGNQLTGEIPASLGNLSNLRWLWLTENQLTGEIPDALGNLTNLEDLVLYRNRLTGEIPAALGNLTNLERLDLDINQLTGEIPAALGNLTNLELLNLDINQLTGEIPAALGNLTNLYELRLGNNRLTGTIPAALGNLTKLGALQLNGNQLTGTIPAGLGNMVALSWLEIDNDTGLCLDRNFPLATSFGQFALAAGILVCGAPDLIVEPPTVSDDTLTPGQSFTLFVTVRNQGSADTGLLNLNFYRSTDAGISAADTLVAQFQSSPLAAGGTWSDRHFGTAPANAGTYYYGACVEDTTVTESDTTNNCSSGVRVTVTDIGSSSDRAVLEALYNATDGPNWTNNSNWLSNAPLEDWFGVDTDGSGRVTALSLLQNQLSGSIPAELGRLALLEHLGLAENQLNGSIPTELGGLANLEGLLLWRNALSGSIPPALGNLADLETLDVSINALSGSIPAALGNLAHLSYLGLSHNRLTGSIPGELGRLTNLRFLYAQDNELSGSIPAALGNLAILEVLALDSDTGLCLASDFPLASVFARWAQQLGVPVCSTASLMITSNGGGERATITVPENQRAVTTVTASGGTPPYLFQWQSSQTAPDGGLFTVNTATGAVAFVTAPDYENPTDSDRDNNYVLTVWVTDASQPIQYDEQTITVTVTDEAEPGAERAALEALYHATGGPSWTDNTNWLSNAPVGEWFGVTTDASGRVAALDLFGNQLSGPIPPQLGSLTNLTDLVLWGNQLSGPIPPQLGSLTNLTDLDLFGNQLSGPIPPQLGSLTNLTDLVLWDNQLSGPIPPQLGSLTNLTGLYLSRNQLSGPIPPELGHLANLDYMFLSDNELSGPIPPALVQLTNLQRLNVGGNDLTGPFAWLGNMTNLRDLSLWDLGLTGPVPAWLGNLTNLEVLNLTRNALTGPVPAWLGNLTNLEVLSLSRNALTGPVPAWLGNPTNLHSLYLYANPLAGPLPQSLTQLPLRAFWVHFTQACAPADGAYQAWLATIRDFRGTTCGQAPTGSFTDATLTPGVTGVRWIHVVELRQLVNTVRAACELPRAEWTDPNIAVGATPIKAVHLTELRNALTAAYRACLMTPPSYTDPVIVRRVTPIKAAHWTELRSAGIQALTAAVP